MSNLKTVWCTVKNLGINCIYVKTTQVENNSKEAV